MRLFDWWAAGWIIGTLVVSMISGMVAGFRVQLFLWGLDFELPRDAGPWAGMVVGIAFGVAIQYTDISLVFCGAWWDCPPPIPRDYVPTINIPERYRAPI